MPQPKQPAGLLRNKLVAVAAIALSAYFATAVGVAAANVVQAHPGPPAATLVESGPQTDEEIWEEEGWDESNSEEAEAEEAEEEAEEADPTSVECNLYSTTARIVTSDRNDSVHLTVRYETSEATSVKVEYWLKGARGTFQLESLRRHMSTRGTLHGSERLSTREMAKARAARVFVVHLDIPGLPQGCERYCTRRLTSKHESGSRVTWSEPALYTRPVR